MKLMEAKEDLDLEAPLAGGEVNLRWQNCTKFEVPGVPQESETKSLMKHPSVDQHGKQPCGLCLGLGALGW